MDEYFGVGMVCGEPVPGTLQRFAQLHVIVDLAIEDNRDRPILVEHRLLARRHVYDGKAAHSRRNARSFPKADSVCVATSSIPVLFDCVARYQASYPAHCGSVGDAQE
jgi:hypothetical protein